MSFKRTFVETEMELLMMRTRSFGLVMLSLLREYLRSIESHPTDFEEKFRVLTLFVLFL